MVDRRSPIEPPPAGEPESPASADDAPASPEITTGLVVVAYLLALVCTLAPLAILGAGFAGAVLFTRGRRGAGAGVIALAAACSVLGVALLR